MLAGGDRAHQVVARRFEPAHHLDDQVGVGEDLLEVAARARQHAADHRTATVEALDLVGALVEQRRERGADGAVSEQADLKRRLGAACALRISGHRGRSDRRKSHA
jgi:hypothetical protein